MRFLLAALLLQFASACGSTTGEAVDKGAGAPVSYEFYRNATAKLYYNGQSLLLDPMLSAKGALPSFAGIAPNPTVELPVPAEEIISEVDAVVVGHMHPDHFDMKAAEILAKSLPVFTPNNKAPVDPSKPVESTKYFAEQLREMGFRNVQTIGSAEGKTNVFRGIRITEEFAMHGRGVLQPLMGGVNGIVFEADGQPTIYWTGDTILDEEGRVEEILMRYKPDIVIAHTGGAVIAPISPDPLMMDEDQAIAFFRAAQKHNDKVKIVAVHMNALDHCFTTRESLAAAVASAKDLHVDVRAPREGDKLTF